MPSHFLGWHIFLVIIKVLYLHAMKIKRNNIIKNFAQSIVIKRYVLALFITHLVLAHVILQNYILCFENDGRVVLESVLDLEDCCNSTSTVMTAEIIDCRTDEDCSFCEDVAISENCDEEYLITTKQMQPLIAVVLFSNNAPYPVNKIEFSTVNKNEIKFSPQLDSYKTVLLLI